MLKKSLIISIGTAAIVGGFALTKLIKSNSSKNKLIKVSEQVRVLN